MEDYVYKKEVDWSLFKYGFAIPLEQQVVFKQIADRFIERGESRTIRLYLNGKSYEAKLNNNNIDKKFGRHADIVQVRYGQNSEIAEELKGLFKRSYSYISGIKQMQEKGSKSTYLCLMNIRNILLCIPRKMMTLIFWNRLFLKK